jgi:hypothetical protein
LDRWKLGPAEMAAQAGLATASMDEMYRRIFPASGGKPKKVTLYADISLEVS